MTVDGTVSFQTELRQGGHGEKAPQGVPSDPKGPKSARPRRESGQAPRPESTGETSSGR